MQYVYQGLSVVAVLEQPEATRHKSRRGANWREDITPALDIEVSNLRGSKSGPKSNADDAAGRSPHYEVEEPSHG